MRKYIEPLESRCLPSSVAGLWVGTRTEAGLGGIFATVMISMNLTESSRHVWGAETRMSSKTCEYFADILTHGSFVGSTFYLQDEKVTAQKTTPNYQWLLYTATLQLSADGQTLSGAWHAGKVHGTMTFQHVVPTGHHHHHRA